MSDILQFDQFAGSSRGLIARPVMMNNVVALAAHVASMGYIIKNITDDLPPVTGPIPLSCIYATVQPWDKDKKGFSLLWEVDGSLWPLPGKQYRTIVQVNLINPFLAYPNLAGKSFLLAWQANTKDPLG